MSTSLHVTFFAGKKGGLICRLPSGKIGFPSRSFRTPPQEGEHCEVIIEEEREKVAWVGPADPSFLVTFVRRNVSGRDLNFFEDATGRLYVEGFNWDWSHPYPRLGEQWRVSVQTVKNGETYVLPHGDADNPFPKKIRADHPRAEQVAGCWKYSTYFSSWMFIQAIKVNKAGEKSFEVIFDDGRLSDISVIESEAIFREKFDTVGLRFDAIDRQIKENSIR